MNVNLSTRISFKVNSQNLILKAWAMCRYKGQFCICEAVREIRRRHTKKEDEGNWNKGRRDSSGGMELLGARKNEANMRYEVCEG